MSTITLKVLELIKSLPPLEQQAIRAELNKPEPHSPAAKRRKLQRLADGTFINPDGIPNEDPIFKILEQIEDERHLEQGAVRPQEKAAWPPGFFEEIHIKDPAFERPAQGTLPPISSVLKT